MHRIHEDAHLREPDLLQLVQIASTYPSRERFLTELTLDPPEATSARAGDPLLDDDYLILSTIHSAKGQEWKSVFILNTVDGCLPSDLATGTSAEIEEERRLLYVAMTRAKDHLHLMVPQRFFVHAPAEERRPSSLRVAHPLYSVVTVAALRMLRLAAGGRTGIGKSLACSGRSWRAGAPELGLGQARFQHQSLIVRSRSALPITHTDEKAIAAAAIIGESSRPKTG